jgi:small subunit ribosomal protein S1
MSKKTEKLLNVPVLKEGQKLQWVVVMRVETGILVDCADGAVTGIILQKEMRDLLRNGVDLSVGASIEAELINPTIRHKEGYYIISVTKLLQIDVWKNIISKIETNEIFTVVPTEANLWGLLVDMHGIKWFIPLSQLAPIHYPRVEDGDQEQIFDKLLDLIGKEFNVRAISIDEEEKRVILSEREALKEETEKILAEIEVGKSYDGVVSGVSSYGLFVTLGGSVEGLVHISELTFWHVAHINKLAKIGDPFEVKVIGLENGKISLSRKQLKGDPWEYIPKNFKIWDIIEGEIVRFVPYGVFMRIYDDINGLIHLSELSKKSQVKIGQTVQAKLILLDIRSRKIGLSMRALEAPADGEEAVPSKRWITKTPVAKTVITEKVVEGTAE